MAPKRDPDMNSYNQIISQIVMINEANLDLPPSATDFDYEPNNNQYYEAGSLNECERRLLKKACEAYDSYTKHLTLSRVSSTISKTQ